LIFELHDDPSAALYFKDATNILIEADVRVVVVRTDLAGGIARESDSSKRISFRRVLVALTPKLSDHAALVAEWQVVGQ
jgi:hypothetical protein